MSVFHADRHGKRSRGSRGSRGSREDRVAASTTLLRTQWTMKFSKRRTHECRKNDSEDEPLPRIHDEISRGRRKERPQSYAVPNQSHGLLAPTPFGGRLNGGTATFCAGDCEIRADIGAGEGVCSVASHGKRRRKQGRLLPGMPGVRPASARTRPPNGIGAAMPPCMPRVVGTPATSGTRA